MNRPTPTIGGVQQLLYVNESSHYSLILVSKFESAKRFKHQVTSDVLPAIRKRGAFVANNINEYSEKNRGYGETQYPKVQYNSCTTMRKHL